MYIPTFTLLIVEDLAIDRELYRRALSQDASCSYHLLEAESVAEGLTVCRTQSIDGILLDYALPDGDGLTFLAALKAQSEGSSPPVVMVTGMGNEGIAIGAMKLGAEDYLAKRDLTSELLQSTMRMAMENARLRLQLQQAQLTLQVKNQQTTTIWESMTDAYATLDPDWRIVYTNSAATEVFRQMTGLTPAEYLGKSHWEVFPATVGTIVEQEYRRAVTDRVTVHFELFYETADTWFETHAYPSDEGLGIYFRNINERKWLECERIAAEQERDRFFNLSLDLLAIANFEGYFLRLNPAWEQTLGFTAAELMAQPYLNLVHPDDLAATLAVAQGLSVGQMAVSFENRYRCKDGSYRWLSWSSRPYDEQNLVYAVAHDITDRKRDDEALRRSEEFNRSILDSHRDCVKVVDLEGRLLYINDSGQRLMEIDDFTTIEGRPWVEFWQGNDAESIKAALAAAKSGEIGKFEGYCATYKGTPKWWEVVITPIFDRQGNVEQILSVSRDITERKQTEIALQISEELFRSTFEYTSVGMAHVALDGNWMRVNHKLCEILGYSSAELLATTYQAITEPADSGQDVTIVQQLINGEINECTLEKRYIHKQGHYVWVHITVTLIRTIVPDGQLGIPQYFIAVIQDITEQQAVLRDRKQAQADLEQRNQELDSFVYIVSHDLKAPLRGIANLSEWIEEDLDGSLSIANQQQMTLLRSRVYKMEATINELLNYARIGKAVETIESVSIAELLADVIDSIAPPPTFTIELPPELPILSTRRLPLFQVFANLIGNGIKHHHSEAGSIQISIEERSDCYEFSVSDDGPGIAPEHHEQIFTIFQAVNPQNRSDSTGVGLAIVKKMIEGQGGRIWLDKDVKQGARFCFTWIKITGS